MMMSVGYLIWIFGMGLICLIGSCRSILFHGLFYPTLPYPWYNLFVYPSMMAVMVFYPLICDWYHDRRRG